MMLVMALAATLAPVPSEPVARFTASVTIVRSSAEVGPGRADPPRGKPRTTTLADAAGQPRDAIVFDFE